MAVCVVAPRVEAVQQGDAIGVVPTPRPVVLVVEPLLEIRLERAGRVVWRRVANPGEVITGPMAWPGLPLAPGEVVLLRLRPESWAGEFCPCATDWRFGGSHGPNRSLDGCHGPEARGVAAGCRRRPGPGRCAPGLDAALCPECSAFPELQQLRNQVLQQGCGE